MTMPLFISYFTPEYHRHAQRLISSLNTYELEHEVMPIEGFGKWKLNCLHKAEFIRTTIQAFERPVVWVDADAELMKYPGLFHLMINAKIDHSAHDTFQWPGHRKIEYLSGTMFFNYTPKVLEMLDRVVEVMSEGSYNYAGDQEYFGLINKEFCGLYPETKWRFTTLPRSYCQIENAPRMKGVDDVILHHQASRTLRHRIGKK